MLQTVKLKPSRLLITTGSEHENSLLKGSTPKYKSLSDAKIPVPIGSIICNDLIRTSSLPPRWPPVFANTKLTVFLIQNASTLHASYPSRCSRRYPSGTTLQKPPLPLNIIQNE